MAGRALGVEHAGKSSPVRPVVLRLADMNNEMPIDDSTAVSPEGLESRVPDAWRQWWHATAQRMWPAWQGLERWENTALDEFEATLGEFILLLWSVHRFTENDAGAVLFEQVIDEHMHPTFRDPVLEDIVEVAFALGAAWAEDRGRGVATPPEQGPHILRPDPQA